MIPLLLAALLTQASAAASLKVTVDGGKTIVLSAADRRDATTQVIVPGELRPARWARQVVSIAVQTARP
jgi:hypothetical protein